MISSTLRKKGQLHSQKKKFGPPHCTTFELRVVVTVVVVSLSVVVVVVVVVVFLAVVANVVVVA